MAEVDSIDNLLAARNFLNASLEKSRVLAVALDKTGPRLEEIKGGLSSLEAAFRSTSMRKCSLGVVRDQIDCAIGPAAAVLKVFDGVRELEKSLLSEPCSDLSKYLSIMKQLEEAMIFLAGNCRLSIEWLEGIAEAFDGSSVVDDQYISRVKKCLRILQELQATDVCARLNGGLLFEASNKLETEFKDLVTQHTIPYVLKLQAIIDRLNANGRLENCISIYAEIRSSNVRRSLEVLDLEYLEKSMSESDDVQDIERFIDNWCEHFELVVKHVFEPEYKLCNDVFDKTGSDACMRCFEKIAAQSGILSFLQFGMNVTESKKNPLKLLKLLEIFSVLDSLRVDINLLFGGDACLEIKNLTRDLVKRVVDGVCEVFWELPLQVELQRQISPPINGTVPRLVSFVTDYSNQLLGEDYRPILTQVLVIHQSWKQEKFEKGLLTSQIYNIIKEIALNLDAWSSSYEDNTLSYLFMMNNHCHFCNLKGTELGEMLGDSWLKAHEQYRDYYVGLYVRESWGNIFALLRQGRKSNARDSAKKRLKAFNEAFDYMYKKQSFWVVADKSLREKICNLVVQAFVPVYRSYLQSYGVLVEQDVSASKNVKYSVYNLEKMLSSMFQPKLRKYGSSRHFEFIGKIKNVVTNQFHLMLTAT
ncbi:hypothetical protein Pint_30509 [Pistacia integerrima]|uniref:Uncharacterized protein n=1 Tax=Pistacia integerrima TaxID=434235 RepID=A0ACC0X2F3_9ROSI|nr:hypothetical protein Pint_30509 [Pistacia integerrima]